MSDTKDPLIEATVQRIANDAQNQLILESTSPLTTIISDLLDDIRGFGWEEDVELAIAVLNRAARDAKNMARSGSPDAKAVTVITEILRKLERLLDT